MYTIFSQRIKHNHQTFLDFGANSWCYCYLLFIQSYSENLFHLPFTVVFQRIIYNLSLIPP